MLEVIDSITRNISGMPAVELLRSLEKTQYFDTVSIAYVKHANDYLCTISCRKRRRGEFFTLQGSGLSEELSLTCAVKKIIRAIEPLSFTPIAKRQQKTQKVMKLSVAMLAGRLIVLDSAVEHGMYYTRASVENLILKSLHPVTYIEEIKITAIPWLHMLVVLGNVLHYVKREHYIVVCGDKTDKNYNLFIEVAKGMLKAV